MKKSSFYIFVVTLSLTLTILCLTDLTSAESNINSAFATDKQSSTLLETSQLSILGMTARVSVASDGTEGIYGGHEPSVSGDGNLTNTVNQSFLKWVGIELVEGKLLK